MPPRATLDLFSATQRRALATMLGVRRLWGRLDESGNWLDEWLKLMPGAVVLVGSAQAGAAADGAASVGAGLRQAGFPEQQLADARPAGFVGWLEDPDTGVATTLDRALLAPVIHARAARGSGEVMLERGRRVLEAITQTAVADAARHAVGVQAVATARTVATWYEPPPYCQRCAVLIGKRVKPTTQFSRHPRCDGQVYIMSERDSAGLPSVGVDDVTDLTVAQQRAIADGADMNQVINAKSAPRGGRDARSPLRDRGRSTVVGGGRAGTERLTPKGIYEIAGDDQGLVLELLRQHGYLT